MSAYDGWLLGPDHTDKWGGPRSTFEYLDPPFLVTVKSYQNGYVSYTFSALSSHKCERVVGPNYIEPPPEMGWLLITYGLPLILALMARLLAGRGVA